MPLWYHNGDAYWYLYHVLNLQGDVVRIVNYQGTARAEYSYNAWGGITSATGTLANINPLRYRGYVYDSETGFYYLNSRYYDPSICRFINADTFASTDITNVSSCNMYAYCENRPTVADDADGKWLNIVIGAAVGGVIGVMGQVVSDIVTSIFYQELTISNWQTYTGALVGGAAGGAVLGTTGNVALANAASGYVTTGIGLSLEKITGASDKSWREIAFNTVCDGAISYLLGKLPGVSGITKGRNSMSAVYKSGLTRLRHGSVKKMSLKVIGKGVKSSFVGGLAMDIYYGLKAI